MNDRYLFKAKRTENGEWVEWNALAGMPHSTSIKSETLCQCTGLKDKNCKLIWENDIVEVAEEKYLIEWEQDSAMWGIVQIGSFIVNFDNLWSHEVEVIGNRFDNPELIESEETV